MADFIFAASTLVLLFSGTWCYPNGAPHGACVSMAPNHGSANQAGSAPVTVTMSRTNISTCDDQVEFTISASTTIKGYLCQARISENESTTTGEFVIDSGQTNKCNGMAAVTHDSGSNKTSVTLKWKPTGNPKSFKLICTIVQVKAMFWVGQEYGHVIFTGQSGLSCSSGGTNLAAYLGLMTVALVVLALHKY